MTLKIRGTGDAGREFQTGPATEKARSPNLVTVGGTVYDDVSVEERSPRRRDDAALVRTMSLSH